MTKPIQPVLGPVLLNFIRWLDDYGETSYDFQTFYAGAAGRNAKALYYRSPRLGMVAVSPLIFCEAFVPTARRLFWQRQRFPIADAHYCMGFATLYHALGREKDYRRAIQFLKILLATACEGYSGHAWGYPFDWQTINGTIAKQTPLITTVPYVYEAFAEVHSIDQKPRWLEIMRSIAEHALLDYRNHHTSETAASCSYTPDPADVGTVVNASAYRAFLLTKAAVDFGDSRYQKAAERNLNFVLESQNADGSWYYAMDGRRHFIDHFHTCFVLKALTKIERLTGHCGCTSAIDLGVHYYVTHLFDGEGLPRPFSKAPRLTVYRRELYDYAECINLGTLLQGRCPDLDQLLPGILDDLLGRWLKVDGSFRSRQLLFGWDNVPMHRWAQAQLFRSLCARLYTETRIPSPARARLGVGSAAAPLTPRVAESGAQPISDRTATA